MYWFFLLVLNALAVHRLTVLVIEDKITEPLRNKIFDRWNPADTWTYLFTCPWCVSIWIAGIAVLGLWLIPTVWFYVALILASSTIVGLIEEKR